MYIQSSRVISYNLYLQFITKINNNFSEMADTSKDDIDNEEIRCRICYQERKPLITICECLGSIAYVHQDCILDWINNNILKKDISEMFCCQICKSFYSIDLKVGKKESSLWKLVHKIKSAKLSQVISSICIVILTLLAIYINTLMIIPSLTCIWKNMMKQGENSMSRNIDLFTFCYTNIFIVFVFPIFYIKVFFQCIKQVLHYQDVTDLNKNITIIFKPKIIIDESNYRKNYSLPLEVNILSENQ